MNALVDTLQNTVVEELLAEFIERLRSEGKSHFELMERCPELGRRELLSLMNVAALAYRALEPDRKARGIVREMSNAA